MREWVREKEEEKMRERERERENVCACECTCVCVCVCVYVLEQGVVSSTLLDLIHHSLAAQVWVGEGV